MSLQSFVFFVIFLLTTENIKPTVSCLKVVNDIDLWKNTSHKGEFEDQLDIETVYEINSKKKKNTLMLKQYFTNYFVLTI